MGLIGLKLRDFRCFEHAELEFSSGGVNLIWGSNASGKTSLLEAVFLLGRGRSFRSAQLDPLSQFGSAGFQVSGRVATQTGSITLGLAKQQGELRARVRGQPAVGLAELAETFPVQLVDSQAHHLVDGSPRYRRQFLDWGVFHVEPDFFPAWRRYQRALQQRNALLRSRRPLHEVGGWDNELIAAGERIDLLRRRYLDVFSGPARQWAGAALAGQDVTLEYRAGWPEAQSLAEAMTANRERDRQYGITQVGPHRADLLIRVAGRAARDRISRGQEKALAGTLLLAQAMVHRSTTGRACTLLLDDLPSELDPDYLERFTEQVLATGSQAFITAIDRKTLPSAIQPRLFHVEQGKITPMV